MKKKLRIPLRVLLALLLVAGGLLAFWLLSPKRITKAILIQTVNQSVALLRKGLPPEQESSYERLEEWLSDRETELSIRIDQNDYVFSASDGNLYVRQPSFPQNQIYTLHDGLLTTVRIEKGGYGDYHASIVEIEEPEMPDRLQLDLPEMTEADVTEAGDELIISRDYLSRLLVAVLNGMPPSEQLDPAMLATIKTAIPGVIENLGLRLAIQTRGDFLYAVSLSFFANEELLTMLQLPADTTLDGELLYAVRSKEESALSLRITDRLTAETTVRTDYLRGEPSACHVTMDMTVKEGFASTTMHTLSGVRQSMTLWADQRIHADVTVDLSDREREGCLPPIEATLTITRELSRITLDGEETAYDDLRESMQRKIDNALEEQEKATLSVSHEQEDCDTLTWKSNVRIIPLASVQAKFYPEKAPSYPLGPVDELNGLLQDPHRYLARAQEIRDFLAVCARADVEKDPHNCASYSVYHHMDDVTIVVNLDQINNLNIPPKFSFYFEEHRETWPPYYHEVVLENGVFRMLPLPPYPSSILKRRYTHEKTTLYATCTGSVLCMPYRLL